MSRLTRLLPLALFLVSGLAAAQEDDPPERVARLSYVQGEVSLAPEGTEDWTAASLNRPLTTGDQIWVDRESRAELQTGEASIHLDQSTQLSFIDLNDNNLRISLTDGTINLRLNSLDRNEVVEVETPNATVSLARAGEYRIAIEDDSHATSVGVRSGETDITHDQQTFGLQSGQQGRFSGTSYLTADVHSIDPRDDFEAWADDRNRRDERSVSSQYVSPEVVGYEDLDDYGSWSSEPDYGYVWYPRTVSLGWSPYRFGHWAWVAPWGWTWIDRAPWGFAPFHYGRWAYLRSRWCWVPGPRHLRPVYAPALVAWVGRGTNVGWFPLGPREVYVPRHRASERYVQRVNSSNTTIVNNTDITNVYRNRGAHVRYINQRAPGAVTAVPQQTFRSARPVENHAIRVNEREASAWRPSAEAPAITPTRESLTDRDRREAVGVRPPSHVVERNTAIRQQRLLRREVPVSRPAAEMQNRVLQDRLREQRREAERVERTRPVPAEIKRQAPPERRMQKPEQPQPQPRPRPQDERWKKGDQKMR